MTAQDTFHSMKIDEVVALRREVSALRAENENLRSEIAKLKTSRGPSWPAVLEPVRIKKLKVGPPQHPGQLSISGTEEAK